MTKEKTGALIEALEEAGYEWRPYSGRGMNGAQCVGVALESVAALYELGWQIGETMPLNPSIDNMGRGIVAYWYMTKEKTGALIEALEEAGYEWRPYSGRGMNGAQCVGVALESVAALYELGWQIGETMPLNPSIDNMDRGIVAYWPSRRIVED